MDSIKSERITARVSDSIKQTIDTAANLSGATLNQFVVQAALEKAETIIENDKLIRLSQRDSAIFFDLLENPPEPNSSLKKAVENYKRQVG